MDVCALALGQYRQWHFKQKHERGKFVKTPLWWLMHLFHHLRFCLHCSHSSENTMVAVEYWFACCYPQQQFLEISCEKCYKSFCEVFQSFPPLLEFFYSLQIESISLTLFHIPFNFSVQWLWQMFLFFQQLIWSSVCVCDWSVNTYSPCLSICCFNCRIQYVHAELN